MDVNDILLQGAEASELENTPGDISVRELEMKREREAAALNAEATKKAMVATNLESSGPSSDDYDYEAAHREGQGFAKDDDGGSTLKNRYARPRRYGIAGYDMANGDRVIDHGLGEAGDEWVRSGVDALRGSHTSTTRGTPISDTPSLARIAYAYASAGGTVEEYKAAVGPQHAEKADVAWDAAEKTDFRMRVGTDLERAAQEAEEMQGFDATEEPPREIEDLFDPANMMRNPDWMRLGRAMYPMMEGEDFTGTDVEMNDWALEFMSAFNNNIPAMASVITRLTDADPDTQQAFLEMMYMYDDVADFDLGVFGRALKYYAMDPLTYVGVGVGSYVAKQATKKVAQAWVKRIITNAAAGGVEEGILSTARGSVRQKAEIEAGAREKADLGELAQGVAIDTAIGAVAGGVLGEAFHYGFKLMKGAIPKNTKPTAMAIYRKDIAPSAPLEPPSFERGIKWDESVTRENIRLHLQRDPKNYPGGPKNPRTVIKGPKGLPDIVVGAITAKDWFKRQEKLLNSQEISEASGWYNSVLSTFTERTGDKPETTMMLMDAWLGAQQNASPESAMNNVLHIYEKIQGGTPVDEIKGKGLPNVTKLVINILTGKEVTGGAGQKISDFIDAARRRITRSIMGDDPAGGAPFVVDIHTARDTGLIDQKFINHLKRLGYTVPEGLQIDIGGGGIKGTMYENRAIFGRKLTEEANARNWQGRSDWTASEIQAVGWMGMTKLYSGGGTTPAGAFERNVRRISMEAKPGKGSRFEAKYGKRLAALPPAGQAAVSHAMSQKAIDVASEITGIRLGDVVHASGGWVDEGVLGVSPSTVHQALASKGAAIEAAKVVGLLLQQSEVWVNSIKLNMTKNPKAYAIDATIASDAPLTSAQGEELFRKLMDADDSGLIQGFQPVTFKNGRKGIRVIIKQGGKKAAAAVKSVYDKADDIFASFDGDVKIKVDEAEVDILSNDWRRQKNGQGYQGMGGGAGSRSKRAVLDTHRSELDKEFDRLLTQAEAETGQIGPGGPQDGGAP